jgi:hypothetical protein
VTFQERRRVNNIHRAADRGTWRAKLPLVLLYLISPFYASDFADAFIYIDDGFTYANVPTPLICALMISPISSLITLAAYHWAHFEST